MGYAELLLPVGGAVAVLGAALVAWARFRNRRRMNAVLGGSVDWDAPAPDNLDVQVEFTPRTSLTLDGYALSVGDATRFRMVRDENRQLQKQIVGEVDYVELLRPEELADSRSFRLTHASPSLQPLARHLSQGEVDLFDDRLRALVDTAAAGRGDPIRDASCRLVELAWALSLPADEVRRRLADAQSAAPDRRGRLLLRFFVESDEARAVAPRFASDEDPDTRVRAALALLDPRALEVAALMSDARPALRARATRQRVALPDVERTWLGSMLFQKPVEVLAAAIEAVLDREAPAPLITAAFASQSEANRRSLLRALIDLRAPERVECAQHALHADSDALRREAADVLAEALGPVGLLKHMRPLLDPKHPDRAGTATAALSRHGTVDAVPVLRAFQEAAGGESARWADAAVAAIQSRVEGAVAGGLAVSEVDAGALSVAEDDPR